MTKTEMAKFLAVVAAVDHRQIDKPTVEVWHQIVGYLDLQDALDAHVEARRDASIRYLEPRHIVQFAAVQRRRRVDAVPAARALGVVPAGWPDHVPLPTDAFAALQERRAGVRKVLEVSGGDE